MTCCALEGIIPAFPPTANSLCLWIASLGNTGHVKTATIKLYLTGLRSYCIDLGTADLSAFEDPRPQRILRGVKIFHAARETEPRERLPITRDPLLRLVSRLDTSTHKGATLRAAFCVAFAAFLRIGEFTWSTADWKAEGEFHQWHMTRSSAQFHPTQGNGIPERLLLTLPASKTDPFRRGITLTIAAAGDGACAVEALHHLTTWPSEPHAPLFSNIPFDTFHANHCLASFNRNWVVSQLRHLLIQAYSDTTLATPSAEEQPHGQDR